VSPNGGLKAAPPPPQKQNSEHTRGELKGLVVYGDVRIGHTLHSSSCSTRYELNLLLGRKKMSVGKNKNKCPPKKIPTSTSEEMILHYAKAGQTGMEPLTSSCPADRGSLSLQLAPPLLRLDQDGAALS
jgi:hypothetical protein